MLKAELIGNLGADAEVKNGDGYSFISMRVANTEKWQDENGGEHSNTDWIDVVWNKTDSALLKFLKGGTKIYVRGFVRQRVYSSAKDRKMKAGMTISATEIELCGGNSDLVPRQLIIPESGAIVDVRKYYRADVDTKGWKKDDIGFLVDKAGNQFQMVKDGWVCPAHPEDETQGEAEPTQETQQ
jgi:single-strand DNA-binding protein